MSIANQIGRTQKLWLSTWIAIPSLVALILITLVREKGLYELLFWVELRDIYPEYEGLQPQNGVQGALRHIFQHFPWYIYPPIAFAWTYYFSRKILLTRRSLRGFAVLFSYVFSIYVLSAFCSILYHKLGGWHGISGWQIPLFIVYLPLASLGYTLSSYFGGSALYAPYALPSLPAAVVMAALMNWYGLRKILKSKPLDETKRFWLAVVIAPLTAPLLYAASIPLRFDNSGIGLWIVLGVLPQAYACFVLFIFPVVLYLKVKRKLVYKSLIICGVTAGPLCLPVLQFAADRPLTYHGLDVWVLATLIALSVSATIVFGLLAVGRKNLLRVKQSVSSH